MSSKSASILSSDEDREFLLGLKKDFFIETKDSIEKAEKLILDFEENEDELVLLEYKRLLHSIKGSAKAVDENVYALIVHKVEDRIQGIKDEVFFDKNLKFLDLSKQYIQSFLNGENSEDFIF
jgi:chemotaxis protein histidine kinase CheA